MKKRFLTLILNLTVMLMCVCGLSACGECEHEWGEWSVSAHSTCLSQGTKQRKCSKCEEIQTDFLDIGEHLYDAENIVWTWNGYESATATLSCVTDSTHTKQINANVTDEVTTEPTCIETGTKTYTATVKIDGVTYTATKNETLAALGHTEVTDAAVAATCEKTGLTEGSHCSVCKEILVAQKEVSANGHNYDIENIVWTWNGYESATATVSCITDSTHTRQINANITDEITTAATCTETGVKTYTATIVIDGKEYKNTKTDNIESNGHSWNDGEVTANASAVADGELTYTCLFCPQTKIETFSYPISREDWNRAFGTLFASDNITANLLSIGDDITTNVIYYLDGTKMQGVLVEENGNNEIYYAREHDVDYRYGFYDGEWEKIALEDEITYSVRNVVVQDMIWDEIIGGYSSFVYVNQTDKFIAPNLTITIIDEEIIWYISSIALTIDKGIVSRLEFVIIDEDDYTENVCIVFNGLGTTEVTLPHIHVWSDWREETTVSCTNDGLNIRSCATCGETQEEIVYSEGHNYEPTVVSPTCEAQGYTTHTCSTCGDSYIDSYKSALGHAWGSWKANAVSTKTIRDCTNNCGEHQEIISVTAECIGDYYRLIGENVSSDDIVLYALINDEEGSIIEIDDFTLENTAMALDGENKVIVKYYTMTTIASVVAIHDNLPNTTSSTEFTWYFDEGNNCYNLTGYSGSSTEIVIPAHISRIPVRVINERVFRYNSNIVSVTIPPSIQTIGDRAFEGCTALKTLTLNEGLKSIGSYAFSGCPIMTLSIPDTVKTVGNGVFNGCTKLTTVVIGDGLNGISYEMFRGCSALKSITIGDAVETIGEYALYDCVSLEEVVFGESVISIYSYAFRYCSSLASINIPSNVQTIGDRAFDGCTALKTLTLNEGLKSIGSYAFSGCPIVTLSIPDTVKTVESGVFNGCTKLTTVVIGDGLNGISYEMFRGCSALKSITIGDAVETIGEYALYDCVSLEEVVFGESVISIYNYAFRYCSSLASINIPSSVQSIGSRAFDGCTALKTLTLNEGLKSIGSYAFSGCPIVTLSIPDTVKTVESGVFNGCTKLTTAVIGDGLNGISYEMFKGCSELKNVTIGNAVEYIGEYAFGDCAALTDITFGSALLSIHNYAFRYCSFLSSINIPSTVQSIGSRVFDGCTALKTLTLNEGLKSIGSYAFSGCPIVTLSIPDTVKTVESGVFSYCKKLESVTIGAGLNNISYEMFRDCSALKTVVVGDGVESIGEYAFAYCSALNNIKLGNGLLAIYNYAFRDCTALTTIVIPNSVQTIGDRAFEGCTLLVNFNIGTGVQRIGAYALQNCSSLKSVAIPTNVQVIGAGLFNNCSSLEEVIIEKGVLREVGNDVFNGCSNFDRMYYTGTASDWVLVAVSEDNSYPLNVSPYYYSSSSPSGKGNYWYYNSNGEIRVWNVSETSFKAEEYSEKFANSTFGSSNTSYSSQFLSQLEGDSLFQARILIWEALHIATDSSWESKAISKKDVYKMVIYDLLVGEADAQVNPLAGMDAACNSYVYDFAKFLLGKDSLTKAELDQLKNLSPLDYDYVEMVDKYFKGIDVLKEVFEMSTNLYDALYVAAQYKALSDMDTNFYLVLTEISNDGSLPWDLRNAASECADCYKTATDALLKKIVVQEFASSTMEVLWKDFQDEAWKAVLGSVFPQVKFADLTIKGAMFLANMGFNLDACNEAYYQLEAAVGLENALRNVIKNTLPDYLRYNYKHKSEYYMYAIDMYQTSVLLGFDYSNNLLKEHSKSADVNAEEKQAYENMMAQISGMKQEKATMYNNFESVIEQLYIAYYA